MQLFTRAEVASLLLTLVVPGALVLVLLLVTSHPGGINPDTFMADRPLRSTTGTTGLETSGFDTGPDYGMSDLTPDSAARQLLPEVNQKMSNVSSVDCSSYPTFRIGGTYLCAVHTSLTSDPVATLEVHVVDEAGQLEWQTQWNGGRIFSY